MTMTGSEFLIWGLFVTLLFSLGLMGWGIGIRILLGSDQTPL
jgi:hypothetical protein